MVPVRSRTESALQIGHTKVPRALKSLGEVGQTGSEIQNPSSQADVLASVLSTAFSERRPGSPSSDRLYARC